MHSLGANLQLYANAQIESFIFGGAPVYIKQCQSNVWISKYLLTPYENNNNI